MVRITRSGAVGIELDKPVIAATSGWVVGGAFVLVQMADLCVASETTRFIYPEGKIGTTAGGVSSVMARMPHKIAMEFLLVGEEMSAEDLFDAKPWRKWFRKVIDQINQQLEEEQADAASDNDWDDDDVCVRYGVLMRLGEGFSCRLASYHHFSPFKIGRR